MLSTCLQVTHTHNHSHTQHTNTRHKHAHTQTYHTHRGNTHHWEQHCGLAWQAPLLALPPAPWGRWRHWRAAPLAWASHRTCSGWGTCTTTVRLGQWVPLPPWGKFTVSLLIQRVAVIQCSILPLFNQRKEASWFVDDDELMLNVLRCHLTY